MNTIIKNNKEYKLIGFWNDTSLFEIKDKINTYDSHGKKFLIPKNNKEEWLQKNMFIDKLTIVQILLKEQGFYKKYDKESNCVFPSYIAGSKNICDEKNIITTQYYYKKFIWNDGLIHYIDKHNFIPDETFQDLIFFYKLESKINLTSNIKKIEKNENKDTAFIKINKNQLLILDALLKHGGYTKKYIDINNKLITRYSEHAGLLDFNMNILEKIVIAGNTTRVDRGDNEIFLPINLKNYKEYEYIFHTHPPTPKPGGRVSIGILYEFPSMGDILHFIDSFNGGKVCGSLVVTSEGLYNIRKINLDHNKIDINEDMMFKEFNDNFHKIQKKYIDKYGINFTTNTFYKKISQDLEPIQLINKILNKYLIHIDYYPRIKHKNNWILNIVYLPIY